MGFKLLFFVQVSPKRFKIIFRLGQSAKNGLKSSTLPLQKKAKFTISIGKPGNTAVKSKVSHESYLHIKTTYKVRKTISNGPELIRGNVL